MARTARNGLLALVAVVVLLLVGVLAAVVAGVWLDAPRGDAARPEEPGETALTWVARALLLLSVAWLVIGMLAARTRLVRRPGAAGARAAWLASTRPWRAEESTLGMLPLDRWLMILVPGGLLVATRGVQTALLGWIDLAAVLGGWFVFAVVVRILVGRRSPWPVIAAVGGVIVLRCALALVAVSIAGPTAFWEAFWSHPLVRFFYIVPAVALALWAFVAAGGALAAQFGSRRGWGIVLAGMGAGLALPAAVIALAGFGLVTEAWTGQLPGTRPGLDALIGMEGATGTWGAVVAGVVLTAIGLVLRFLPSRNAERAIH